MGYGEALMWTLAVIGSGLVALILIERCYEFLANLIGCEAEDLFIASALIALLLGVLGVMALGVQTLYNDKYPPTAERTQQ